MSYLNKSCQLAVIALKNIVLLVIFQMLVQCNWKGEPTQQYWSCDELRIIESLWLQSLGPLPPNPSNQYADSLAAAGLGHALFFNGRMSSNGQVSCATCHKPEKFFTDSLPLAVGNAPIERHTMNIVESARSPWLFWDSRADSLWPQALIPLEHPKEHGLDRSQLVRLVYKYYKKPYETVFGPLPDLFGAEWFNLHSRSKSNDGDDTSSRVKKDEPDQHLINTIFANTGKALEAY